MAVRLGSRPLLGAISLLAALAWACGTAPPDRAAPGPGAGAPPPATAPATGATAPDPSRAVSALAGTAAARPEAGTVPTPAVTVAPEPTAAGPPSTASAESTELVPPAPEPGVSQGEPAATPPAGGLPGPAVTASEGAPAPPSPPVTVPPSVRPVVVPSPVPEIPAYVLVQARFERLVTVVGGADASVFLEFRPEADTDDPRWHRIWFRPCEPGELVASFARVALPPGGKVQIALPVNPSAGMRAQLSSQCQASGYRTAAEAERYSASLFAANLQTLRGEDAGVYLGGSLNSLVHLPDTAPPTG